MHTRRVRPSQPPVVSVSAANSRAGAPVAWPAHIPAVKHLLSEGLALNAGITFLVGENGAGKSTIVEGIALAYGMSPEGGSVYARHSTRSTESPLSEWLTLQRGVGASKWGFFLRAETMHSFYTYLEENPGSAQEPLFHEMSHGESFLAILGSRFDAPAFYCLDEPEAALSFSSSLTLIATLRRIADEGGQVLCATHSPIVASTPGATIIEVGPWGMRETAWEDLELVRHWQSYLGSPERYLRHLF